MNKAFINLIFFCFLGKLIAADVPFEFLNKSNKAVDIIVRDERLFQQDIKRKIEPNEKYKHVASIDPMRFKLIITDPQNTNIGVLYTFASKSGKDISNKKIYVRTLDGLKLEPQTFVLNNLDKTNIEMRYGPVNQLLKYERK